MGLISFVKNAGSKLFGKKVEEATEVEKPALQASALLDYVKELNLPFKRLKISLTGESALLEGEVENQEDAEKIALAVGNVVGVETVDNQMVATEIVDESVYHTVEKGEWLSKIAQKHYGDANKYNVIFEANKPMLSDPDKIYPGQVLRIPKLG